MLGVVVIPFDGAVQAGLGSIVGHSRHSGMRLLAQTRNPERAQVSGFRVRAEEARPGMTAPTPVPRTRRSAQHLRNGAPQSRGRNERRCLVRFRLCEAA
jgi:hypothetical protein